MVYVKDFVGNSGIIILETLVFVLSGRAFRSAFVVPFGLYRVLGWGCGYNMMFCMVAKRAAKTVHLTP